MDFGNDWTELCVSVQTDDAEKAENIAQMATPYGIYIEDYSNLEEEAGAIAHIDLFDSALLQKDREHVRIHLYLSPADNPTEVSAFLEERLHAEGVPYTISSADCAMEDWINNWKKYFKPIPVGENLLIRPIWEDEFESDGRTVLNLEPGLAFGTGTDETARLCLELIERYLRPGDRMLDIGCGSGILAVSALLLGAASAVGVDIDPLAVKTAVENAERNGVQDRFTALCGSLTEQVTGTYRIIAANIVADVILALTADVEAFMEPEAVYLMSGIIDTRAEEVLAAVKKKFEILEYREENGWVAIAARRNR